jgi:hypothetical protein
MANKGNRSNGSGINDLFDVYHLRITFEDEILATCGTNEYFAISILREDEKKSVEDAVDEYADIPEEERPMTVFPRNEDGEPFIYDYLIKGFIKNAAKAFNAIGGDKKLASYKSKIDNGLFVEPRQLVLNIPDGEDLGLCCRPLRASTMQGERVTIAKSESAPVGTSIECWIKIMNPDIKKRIFEYLDFGYYNGLGQWHNSGKGKFSYEIIED